MRWVLCFLLLASCGYRFEGGEKTTVAVPYVINDQEGQLTAALIRELSDSPALRYSNDCGAWILSVKIIGGDNERIGYRYDRNPVTGKLRKHLEGIENRRRITAEVAVICSATEEIIYGPQVLTAEMDYDYVDPDSLRDLSVIIDGKRQSIESFSLGQLDTIDAANFDVLRPLYRRMAQQIIDGVTTCCD